MSHPERPHRVGRTRDWRDCQHCRHYTSGGNAGGTPPWTVCQFWPRKRPQTCDTYAYKHKPWLDEDGYIWGMRPAEAEAAEAAHTGSRRRTCGWERATRAPGRPHLMSSQSDKEKT